MLYLKTDQVEVAVDEEKGGDIVSLQHRTDKTEFVHRRGLQAWIKSGDRADPASGVLSNFYAGLMSPKFDVVDQTDTRVMLQAIRQDLKIIKTVEVIEKTLVVSVTLENISSDTAIPIQIEYFCNLSGAKLEDRDATVCFLAENTRIVGSPVYLERFLDRGVKLKSHPELAADFALDIDTVKDIVNFAKSHGLKVGVEFNTPGHQNETGIPEAYPELMEPKPDNIPGHVLCVSNPKTRRLIKDIILELQETIEPDMLMLGGDEVQFEGYKGTPFGHCSLCEKQDPRELFSDYITWLLSLVKTGIRPSIAGDMFLQSKQFGDWVGGNGSEGDLWKAISSVSKNTIVLDWHYFPADEYRSLDFW